MNIFTVTDSKKLTCIIVRFRHPRASWTPISQDNPDFQHVRACRVSIHQSKPFSNKSWPFPEVIYILVPNSDLARRFPENTPPHLRVQQCQPPPVPSESSAPQELGVLGRWKVGCEINPNVDLLLVVGKEIKKIFPNWWFNGDFTTMVERKNHLNHKKREANHVVFWSQ